MVVGPEARRQPPDPAPLHNSARAAALVAAGQAQDEPPLDDAAKARVRSYPLDWLTAELKVWDKLVGPGPRQARLFLVRT
jgi:hypothetical protein